MKRSMINLSQTEKSISGVPSDKNISPLAGVPKNIRMKKGLLLLLLIASASLSAQNNNWQNLFNGKDLKGWKQLNGNAKYEVKNGAIVGTTVSGEPNSFLATEKDYGDFILEVDFLVDSTMNSGIQFRSLSLPEYRNGRVHGYQFEIDPSPRGWSGGIYDEARRDWLYTGDLNPSAKNAFKQGKWNRARVECIGNSIRTWLNGVPVAHVIDDVTSKGFIALQVHAINNKKDEGRQISWKNVRIQTQNIKPSPLQGVFIVNLIPNYLSDAEKKNGVSFLFDGKDVSQWRGVNKDAFPSKGWQVSDGALTVQAAGGGGDIVSKKEYDAFILQFDFKITEGANSGVKYFVTEDNNQALGLEYQILDDAKHPDAKQGVVGNRKLASLYDLIPAKPEGRARRPIGQWNRGMVIVYPDNRIEHWLNGWKLLDYQRDAPYYNALVARSKFAEVKNFGLNPKGHILLQDHGDEVSFRSIKITELK